MNKEDILTYIFFRLGERDLSEEVEANLSAVADQIIIQHAKELLDIE